MAKVLFKKEKKEVIDGKERLLARSRYYYVEDLTQDFHTADGIIAKKDLKKKDGTKILSSKKEEFLVLTSEFVDSFRRLERGPQMPLPKDMGMIIAGTGLGKKSVVVDAGAGSGGLACFLGHLVKHVTTYEVKKEFADLAKRNVKFLGLKNVKVKHKDVARGIDEQDVDVITLDVQEPWRALGPVEKALKPGGFLVCYSTNIPQVQNLVKVVNTMPSLTHQKTIELMERSWKITDVVARPRSQGVLHSGFLTFCRKL